MVRILTEASISGSAGDGDSVSPAASFCSKVATTNTYTYILDIV